MRVNVGFLGLLALLFIGLRLAHVVAWPWAYVLAPLWLPPAFIVGVFLLLLLGIATIAALQGICSPKRGRA